MLKGPVGGLRRDCIVLSMLVADLGYAVICIETY
jgi:hypothetical protein